MPKRGQKGFTLLELLVVVVIIAIVMGIGIPFLLNAINRARQKRTMSDIHALAVAIETYHLDNSFYPAASTISELEPAIEPLYIRNAPSKDGWSFDLQITSSASSYTLGSGGKDGGPLTLVGTTTTDFNDAIVLSNGQFVQWPEGAQR